MPQAAAVLPGEFGIAATRDPAVHRCTPVEFAGAVTLRDRGAVRIGQEHDHDARHSPERGPGSHHNQRMTRNFKHAPYAVSSLLVVTGCLGQLQIPSGAHPLAAGPPPRGEIEDCKHIRNLHDAFFIASAALSATSGIGGVATTSLDSPSSKKALGIVSLVLGVLGAAAATGTLVETNNYVSSYPADGGCPVILGDPQDMSAGGSAPAATGDTTTAASAEATTATGRPLILPQAITPVIDRPASAGIADRILIHGDQR